MRVLMLRSQQEETTDDPHDPPPGRLVSSMLNRLLAGIDPGDRAEVMSGVREHLDTALPGSDPVTDDDVRAALAELGPPHAVADEAYAGRPPAVVPPGHPGSGR